MASDNTTVDGGRIAVTIKEAFLFYSYENPQIASLECLVCKIHLINCCLECRVKDKSLQECPAVKGACGHVFHDHCIQSWCRQRRECPACFNKWVPETFIQRS
ncbi:uncharacterized protein TM35_000281060 [Trypanosoma theileri]|uniref:RING-type domain-containing protein n=1 Tax=Trypanosoma theileri TaxID=67003 RepID=A0A1X0NQI6_9TRYP|nr:uncharacterized protein TM35_000281060 [Trypanosoma theileri]ORC86390.1 hypothetical protein TM35_000281060 [Trypanosoma theileri]